jgi:hypothetical protein
MFHPGTDVRPPKLDRSAPLPLQPDLEWRSGGAGAEPRGNASAVTEHSMARTVAALPAGSRITDYISLGVIAKAFPLKRFPMKVPHLIAKDSISYR